MLTVFEKKKEKFRLMTSSKQNKALVRRFYAGGVSGRSSAPGRFRPPTLRHQRSGATSAGGSVRHTLRHTRPSRFQVSPILSTGPNGILAPPLRERACRRDCAKQSAHMMKQVKKLRTRVSLIKRSLLCSSG